jgi:hypothetical protein
MCVSLSVLNIGANTLFVTHQREVNSLSFQLQTKALALAFCFYLRVSFHLCAVVHLSSTKCDGDFLAKVFI